MISVVCVYNKKEILENYLLKSLKNQTTGFELILLDNRQRKFKSAAEAFNYGGEKAKGNYIMFVHQDIDLCSNSWLEEAEKFMDKLPNLGIAGIAGASEEGIITNIKHGIPSSPAGDIYITTPKEVQTLDECLIIIPKSIFNLLKFDEKVCNDWHLYAVDYCLSIKNLGYHVFVLPMYAYHLSSGLPPKSKLRKMVDLGPLPKSYYKTLRKVAKKHKSHFRKIYTTCGNWNTLLPLALQRIGIFKLLFKILKI